MKETEEVINARYLKIEKIWNELNTDAYGRMCHRHGLVGNIIRHDFHKFINRTIEEYRSILKIKCGVSIRLLAYSNNLEYRKILNNKKELKVYKEISIRKGNIEVIKYKPWRRANYILNVYKDQATFYLENDIKEYLELLGTGLPDVLDILSKICYFDVEDEYTVCHNLKDSNYDIFKNISIGKKINTGKLQHYYGGLKMIPIYNISNSRGVFHLYLLNTHYDGYSFHCMLRQGIEQLKQIDKCIEPVVNSNISKMVITGELVVNMDEIPNEFKGVAEL